MKKPTLQEIKRKSRAAGDWFFDRPTMKLFGETMKSFKVVKIDGKIYIERKKDGKLWLFTDKHRLLIVYRLSKNDLQSC